jgi:hypothetical protein
VVGFEDVVPGPNPFTGIDIPQELEESLRRHREHLSRLIATLRSSGVGETQIRESVSVILASYKEELIRAIQGMVR